MEDVILLPAVSDLALINPTLNLLLRIQEYASSLYTIHYTQGWKLAPARKFYVGPVVGYTSKISYNFNTDYGFGSCWAGRQIS